MLQGFYCKLIYNLIVSWL